MLNLCSILLSAKALGIHPTPVRYWGWYNANDRFRFALMLIGDFARREGIFYRAQGFRYVDFPNSALAPIDLLKER